jgi:hypothetical protein
MRFASVIDVLIRGRVRIVKVDFPRCGALLLIDAYGVERQAPQSLVTQSDDGVSGRRGRSCRGERDGEYGRRCQQRPDQKTGGDL